MGLVVIVILVTLGMFFVVKFMITKQPSEIKTSYTKTQVAANILNSMLKTTSEDCYGMTLTQLLQDCAVNKDTPSQVKCENEEYSCDYAENIIATIFTETLDKWGDQKYDFKAYMDSINDIVLRYNPKGVCEGEREAKQSFIPTDKGIMTINLEVC